MKEGERWKAGVRIRKGEGDQGWGYRK